MTGWECPKCHKVWAPTEKGCPACNGEDAKAAPAEHAIEELRRLIAEHEKERHTPWVPTYPLYPVYPPNWWWNYPYWQGPMWTCETTGATDGASITGSTVVGTLNDSNVFLTGTSVVG